jgi:hypothetical protein
MYEEKYLLSHLQQTGLLQKTPFERGIQDPWVA